MINWNKLTPVAWAIATEQGRDVGVGRLMVQQNVTNGTEINTGADMLPELYRPDWKSLKAEYEEVDVEEGNNHFNVWVDVTQEHYKELCDMWKSKDYAGMVRLTTVNTPSLL